MIREVDSGAVLVNSETGSYFGLNGAAARMFALLTTEPSMDHVADRIAQEFATDADRALRDCEALTRELMAEGLLIEA